MPIVPVVGFWEPGGGLSLGELVAALEGRSDRFADVWLPAADRDAIAGALGVRIADSVRSAEPDEILRAVRDGGLGLVRASHLQPRVRALPLDGSELIGTKRVGLNAAWPLTVPLTVAPEEAWDQAAVITLVAGGDMLMDRGIYERVYNRHKGIDYPFDGGTVRITGRYCCGPFPPFAPEVVPSFVKTGDKGIVRAMLQEADLAFGNLENPITDDWVFRVYGTPFSGKPELTQMFVNAGIDWVSLANNHMLDLGTSGIRDTYRYLRKFGIGFSGAGIDLEQARAWSVQQVGDSTVAILPCVAVAPGSWATEDSAGALPCRDREFIPNIRRAATEADIVIVFPSWGPEYTPRPVQSQRGFAERWIDAGADLIVGFGHHEVAAMEEIDGHLVFYSIGNFVFDQNWSEATMEGILPELTFHAGELVQVDLNPFLTIDQAQPNLLEPESGRAVLRVIRDASEGMLDY